MRALLYVKDVLGGMIRNMQRIDLRKSCTDARTITQPLHLKARGTCSHTPTNGAKARKQQSNLTQDSSFGDPRIAFYNFLMKELGNCAGLIGFQSLHVYTDS